MQKKEGDAGEEREHIRADIRIVRAPFDSASIVHFYRRKTHAECRGWRGEAPADLITTIQDLSLARALQASLNLREKRRRRNTHESRQHLSISYK